MAYKSISGAIMSSVITAAALVSGCIASNPRVIQPVIPATSQSANSAPSGFQDFRDYALKQARGEIKVIGLDYPNLIYVAGVVPNPIELWVEFVDGKPQFRMFLGEDTHYQKGYRAYFDLDANGILSGEDEIYVETHDTVNGRETYETISISPNGNFNLARLYRAPTNILTSVHIKPPIPTAQLGHLHVAGEWVLEGRASYEAGKFSASGVYEGKEPELTARVVKEKAVPDYRSKLEHIVAIFSKGIKPN